MVAWLLLWGDNGGKGAGWTFMDKLHEKEIRVFNRVTKTYPINLLDRDWIVNPDGVKTTHGEPVCSVCGSRKCCLAKKAKVKAHIFRNLETKHICTHLF